MLLVFSACIEGGAGTKNKTLCQSSK